MHSNYSTHDARKPRVRRFRFYETLSRALLHGKVVGTKRTVCANEHATIIHKERKEKGSDAFVVKMNRLFSKQRRFIRKEGGGGGGSLINRRF